MPADFRIKRGTNECGIEAETSSSGPTATFHKKGAGPGPGPGPSPPPPPGPAPPGPSPSPGPAPASACKVNPATRTDCGYTLSESQCKAKGCCYDGGTPGTYKCFNPDAKCAVDPADRSVNAARFLPDAFFMARKISSNDRGDRTARTA